MAWEIEVAPALNDRECVLEKTHCNVAYDIYSQQTADHFSNQRMRNTIEDRVADLSLSKEFAGDYSQYHASADNVAFGLNTVPVEWKEEDEDDWSDLDNVSRLCSI